jgi:hypothetical protein
MPSPTVKQQLSGTCLAEMFKKEKGNKSYKAASILGGIIILMLNFLIIAYEIKN